MTTDLPVIDPPAPEEFVERYIAQNRPVVVRGLDYDPAAWTPDGLRRTVGDLTALVYGALFDLEDIVTLGDYLDDWFGDDADTPDDGDDVPYVRWYNQLRPVAFDWGDEAFARLAPFWRTPSWLPRSFLVPVTAAGAGSDPVTDPFPYRGVLVAAAGARTRLHRDPFCTDAVVCMFHGRKEAALYHPSRAGELLAADDDSSFGGFRDVRDGASLTVEPDHVGVIAPGDMIYIPHGWLHDVVALDDSASVTWNFVHPAGAADYTAYLADAPERDSEYEILRFFHARHGVTDTDPAALLARAAGAGDAGAARHR